MASAVESFDNKAREKFESIGQTTVYRGELLRHPVYTRFLHWLVALFFFLALFSGFGIYLPWLFRWFTPFFGGGQLSRILHPYFGIGFVFFFGLQTLNWIEPMIWTAADSRWMRRLHTIVAGKEKMEPADTGFFNAGQKVQFWEIVIGCVMFLITGIRLALKRAGLDTTELEAEADRLVDHLATDPEYVTSSPRFHPLLMPETTRSGSRFNTRAIAMLTQSVGVPSTP